MDEMWQRAVIVMVFGQQRERACLNSPKSVLSHTRIQPTEVVGGDQKRS